MRFPLMLTPVLIVLLPAQSWAIIGSAMPLNSGSNSGLNALLSDNGYVGAYIDVATAGDVKVTVSASGAASDGINPNMNIWLGDTLAGFSVTPGFTDYVWTFEDLPAGKHFLRTEFTNDRDTARSLTVGSVDVEGATMHTDDQDSYALAAADNYIENYRKGPAKLSLIGATPGSNVEVRLKRHAFNFGTTVPNVFNDTFLGPPGSSWLDPTAAAFKQALVDNKFNSLSAENAGKWASNEANRDIINTMNPPRPSVPYIDYIMDYAEANNIRFRAHNLIWGRNPQGGINQQPTFADAMLQNPTAMDGMSGITNHDALLTEISERIGWYVQDRAQRFYEIDVYNESYHTGSNQDHSSNTYWDVYGASGIAKIYKEVKDAIAAGGGTAGAFVNEYSVLQGQGGDYYANWYTRHIEDLRNAGYALPGAPEVVDGVGFQYYVSMGGHDASRVYATMNNLAVQGLPMSLTEWGGTNDNNNLTTPAQEEAASAVILSETARLVFGMPGTTGITLWNLRNSGSVFAPVGTLYDSNWTIRDTGVAWQALMNQWDTQESLIVDPNGRIDFTGFYGEYEVEINGEVFDLNLTKGTVDYTLIVDIPGDFDDDDDVDVTDLTIWENAYGLNALGDADEDGDTDGSDFLIWQQWFGFDANPLSAAATTVPEPSSLLLAALGMTLLSRRK